MQWFKSSLEIDTGYEQPLSKLRCRSMRTWSARSGELLTYWAWTLTGQVSETFRWDQICIRSCWMSTLFCTMNMPIYVVPFPYPDRQPTPFSNQEEWHWTATRQTTPHATNRTWLHHQLSTASPTSKRGGEIWSIDESAALICNPARRRCPLGGFVLYNCPKYLAQRAQYPSPSDTSPIPIPIWYYLPISRSESTLLRCGSEMRFQLSRRSKVVSI